MSGQSNEQSLCSNSSTDNSALLETKVINNESTMTDQNATLVEVPSSIKRGISNDTINEMPFLNTHDIKTKILNEIENMNYPRLQSDIFKFYNLIMLGSRNWNYEIENNKTFYNLLRKHFDSLFDSDRTFKQKKEIYDDLIRLYIINSHLSENMGTKLYFTNYLIELRERDFEIPFAVFRNMSDDNLLNPVLWENYPTIMYLEVLTRLKSDLEILDDYENNSNFDKRNFEKVSSVGQLINDGEFLYCFNGTNSKLQGLFGLTKLGEPLGFFDFLCNWYHRYYVPIKRDIIVPIGLSKHDAFYEEIYKLTQIYSQRNYWAGYTTDQFINSDPHRLEKFNRYSFGDSGNDKKRSKDNDVIGPINISYCIPGNLKFDSSSMLMPAVIAMSLKYNHVRCVNNGIMKPDRIVEYLENVPDDVVDLFIVNENSEFSIYGSMLNDFQEKRKRRNLDPLNIYILGHSSSKFAEILKQKWRSEYIYNYVSMSEVVFNFIQARNEMETDLKFNTNNVTLCEMFNVYDGLDTINLNDIGTLSKSKIQITGGLVSGRASLLTFDDQNNCQTSMNFLDVDLTFDDISFAVLSNIDYVKFLHEIMYYEYCISKWNTDSLVKDIHGNFGTKINLDKYFAQSLKAEKKCPNVHKSNNYFSGNHFYDTDLSERLDRILSSKLNLSRSSPTRGATRNENYSAESADDKEEYEDNAADNDDESDSDIGDTENENENENENEDNDNDTETTNSTSTDSDMTNIANETDSDAENARDLRTERILLSFLSHPMILIAALVGVFINNFDKFGFLLKQNMKH